MPISDINGLRTALDNVVEDIDILERHQKIGAATRLAVQKAGLSLYLKGGFLAFNIWGCIVSTLCLFPHEFIHAICFREDVYLYTNLKNGMLFVTGTEDMSKFRFVFMSLLPNFVFGFVPFILFMINPSWGFAGTLGALSIPMGAGDYLNVFNAIRQVPKGAKIYMSGMHSYWYML